MIRPHLIWNSVSGCYEPGRVALSDTSRARNIIWNWAKGQFEEAKVTRDKYGKFSSTGTSSGTSGEHLPPGGGGAPKYTPEQLNNVKKHLFPNGINSLSKKEIKKAYLTAAALGLDREEMSKCFVCSESNAKTHLKTIYKKFDAKGKVDCVVKAARKGELDLQKLDLHLGSRVSTNKDAIDKLCKDLESYKNGNHAANPLSPAQTECLRWMACGYNREQISKVYKFKKETSSKSNVKFHIENIEKRLHVKGQAPAVLLGLKYGLVTYDDIDKRKALYKAKHQ